VSRVAVFIFVIGVVFLMLEQFMYDRVDQASILQESLCLPLGSISLCLGVVLFFIHYRQLRSKL